LLTAGASYTGEMLIQHYGDEPYDPLVNENALLPDMIYTDDFWMVNLAFDLPLVDQLTLSGGLDNLTDEIQTDLGDPRTDYNWGPLAGRTWRLTLTYRMDG